jgi:hypothetical protein
MSRRARCSGDSYWFIHGCVLLGCAVLAGTPSTPTESTTAAASATIRPVRERIDTSASSVSAEMEWCRRDRTRQRVNTVCVSSTTLSQLIYPSPCNVEWDV